MPTNLGNTFTRSVVNSTATTATYTFDLTTNTAGSPRVIVPVACNTVPDASTALPDIAYDNTNDYFTSTAHGLVNGDVIVARGSGLPIGTGINALTTDKAYVVLNAATNNFDLALEDTPTVPIDLGADNTLTNVDFFKVTKRMFGAVELTIGSQGQTNWIQMTARKYDGSTGTSYATALTNLRGSNPENFASGTAATLSGPTVDVGAYLTASGDTA